MSADIHTLQPGEIEPLQPVAGERSVYLDAYLAPFRHWLDRDTVTEILVNRPGEVWIEDSAHPGMQKIAVAEVDDRLVQRLAEQVARVSHQGINREHPLLGATLPSTPTIRARSRRAATNRCPIRTPSRSPFCAPRSGSGGRS